MSTIVESKLTLLRGAPSGDAAVYRSYRLRLFLATTDSLLSSALSCWCGATATGETRVSSKKTSVKMRRLPPDAGIHFLASGDGAQPSHLCDLANGGRAGTQQATKACCSPFLNHTCLAFLVSCGFKRARAPASRPTAVSAAVPALEDQRGAFNGEEDGDVSE